MNGKRAFELLKKIGFERISASVEEKKAAEIICSEIKDAGGNPSIEEFDVSASAIRVAKFEVLEPNYKEYEVTGFSQCGSTADEGLEGEFYYYQAGSIVDKDNAKGKIVLVNGGLGRETYKEIVEAGAIGFITFNGELRDSKEDTDISYNELREPLREIKVIPGVNMKIHDAFQLVLSQPKKVRMTIKQDTYTTKSRNVISEIVGTSKKDEVIVLTAHFDSVRYSTGVYDNGAGSVLQMEAFRYFMENKPSRTIKFIWCGSEERGLLGSKAYVKEHNEELKSILMNINCDVAGPVLGRDWIFVTGNNEILNYCVSLASELDFSAKFMLDIYSSDSIPFADNGIPGINVTRFGPNGAAYIHNRHDVLKYLDYKNLEVTGNFLIKLTEKIANFKHIPFDLKIANDVKEKVDKYLFKK